MSGGSDKASRQARADEQARMARISQTQGAVNQVFDDPRRAADIADFVAATREYGTRALDKSKAENDRQLRFALARGGQLGGSVQVDQNRELAQRYQDGLLDVERRAQSAGSQLEAQDQDARARLIQLATSGLDTTTAAQQSAAAMRTNLESARSTQSWQDVGNAFASFQKYYQQAQDSAVRRRADQQAYGLYQQPAGFGYGGGP